MVPYMLEISTKQTIENIEINGQQYLDQICDLKWITSTRLALFYSNRYSGVLRILDYKEKKILKHECLLNKIWCVDTCPKFKFFATGCRSDSNPRSDFSVIIYDFETSTPVRLFTLLKESNIISSYCCVASVWEIYWCSENIIYANDHQGILHVIQLVDFKYLYLVSSILLRCKMAPYIVLDIFNLLLAFRYDTSLSLESRLLAMRKITTIEKQLNFLKDMNEKDRWRSLRESKHLTDIVVVARTSKISSK